MDKEQIVLNEVKERCIPFANKLIDFLFTKGVSFYYNDGMLPNVVFYNEKKKVKIRWKDFYRFSGICCTHRDIKCKKEGEKSHEVEVIPLTDENFYGVYMKAILMEHFFPKPKVVKK